jgi:hypothetical protein
MTTEETRTDSATTTIIDRGAFGRMTSAERMVGRFLRSPDGHPEPAPSPEPAPESAPEPTPELAPAPAPEPAPEPNAATLVRPEGLPDEFWDDATGVKAGDVWSALRDLRVEQEARAADLPAEGEGYDLALPADLQLPEGTEVVIDKDDPLWADFQKIAREAGVPKGKFAEFVGAMAKYQAAAQAADVETYTAEMAKLGENATVRRDSASNWLKANLAANKAEALGGALISADGIAALEDIIKLKSGPVAVTNVGQTTTAERKFGDGWFQSMPAKKTA